jgi:acetyl-CoA carboxylase, biotin carboxylase subunit
VSRISRVLVANRGEIAVRVIKACMALGIEAVAAVSEADKDSLAAKMADRVMCIGPARASDSYLKIGAIIAAAVGAKCDAVHPGYGFLAEQPELGEACAEYGIKFIGPRPEDMRRVGNKLRARKIVRDLNIPVIPGSERVTNLSEALAAADKLGFPVILKAAAGGGGRGMKVVESPEELKGALEVASAEARAGFGDETIYVEHYIPNARHIEVQIIGDQLGNVIHLGERDCSVQRRYQKVIEEALAPFIANELREQIRQAAVTIARSMQYENAGTMEFVYDQDAQQFHFLEVNARIQVEHPITEMISGVDLVQEQIRVAGGEPLSLSQSDVKLTGHAIECRVTAESVEDGFRPSPGRITQWDLPEGEGIRIDTHCYPGYFVPPYYDSLLAKVITVGKDRAEAIQRMDYALDNLAVSGVATTIPFLKRVLSAPDYKEGNVNTRWLEGMLDRLLVTANDK